MRQFNTIAKRIVKMVLMYIKKLNLIIYIDVEFLVQEI